MFNLKKKSKKEALKKVVAEAEEKLNEAIENMEVEAITNNVKVETVETVVDGKTTEKVYRIAVGDHDNIHLSEKQFANLEMAIFDRLDNDDLVHMIWAQHEKKHREAEKSLQIPPFIKKLMFDIANKK